jgi:hypothetical protein
VNRSRWIAVAVFAVAVLVAAAVQRSRSRQVDWIGPPVVPPPALTRPLAPPGFVLTTESESNNRVARLFPGGPATEEARAEIGTAPPPPDDDGPDGEAEWVAEIAVATTSTDVLAALPPPDPKHTDRWVKGRLEGGRWVHVEDSEVARFDRVAVIVDLVDDDKATTAAAIDAEAEVARVLASKLGAPAPAFSMTSASAVAKAASALALRRRFDDKAVDVGVVVSAAPGKRFAVKLVWDVAYSAGFVWGDGDYFHWVPSPGTDVSQGIGMGPTSGRGYFLPEDVAKTDGNGDVDGVEMSFNVARTWHPTKVYDVMAHFATYAARRLGGTITSAAGGPFDAALARERVATIEEAMIAAGVVPGSGLALRLF